MTRAALLLVTALGIAQPSAALNKCVSPEGRVTYTSEPCPDGAKSATKMKLKGVEAARGESAEETYLSARAAFDTSPEAYANYFDFVPTGEAFLAFRKMYDLMKEARLADYRIVDRQASQDGNTVRFKVSAQGRNPITGQRGPFAGDVTMLRKSGRWVIEADNWKIVAGS